MDILHNSAWLRLKLKELPVELVLARAMALNRRCNLWLVPLGTWLALVLSGCADGGSDGSTPETDTTQGFLGPTPTTSTTTWTFILPERSQAMDAQFLIQATFGPTRASLAEIGGLDYDAWLEAQLSLPPTLLRSRYRARANPQVSEDKPAGVPRTSCEVGSRWLHNTFTSADVGARVVANGAHIFVAGARRTALDASYTKNSLPAPMNCSSVGRDWWQWHPHRTCANQIRAWTCSGAEDWTKDKTCQQECFDGGYRYGSDDCSPGWPNFNFTGYLCSVEPAAGVGSQIELSVDAACEDKIVMLNPGLYVPGLTDVGGTFQSVRPSVIALEQSPSNCDFQEFIQVDGQTFQHEPRLKLLDVTSPADVCVAVPKTPMNLEACEVQAGRVCDLARGTDSTLILNSSSLQLLSEHANRHIFTVAGLPTSLSPCGTLARWKLLDCSTGTCTPSSLQSSDTSLIRAALSTQVGGLRDVYVNCVAVPAASVVEVGSDTFQHVHIHEGNVYDFTDWVTSHPGGATAITKWSNSDYKLQYPGNHPVERLETQVNNKVLLYIGKADSEVRYLDLPTSVKTESLALALANASDSHTLSLACPSPGEVANNPKLGNNMPFYYRFIDFADLRNDLDFDHPSEHKHSGRPRLPRISAWMNQVATAPDQLRQRMAWALSQILVVGLGGFTYSEQHEIWVNYYDILVRNAFGNYLDLLREVTFNPLMGEYLSFLRNTAFDHDQNYPDENYAREVMQLFSIGTVELNQDGSWVLDGSGNPMPTYDNDDIMTFASVLTGFDRQEWRSNIEMIPSTSAGRNIIDPMRMVSRWHDAYPKMDLNGNYLGDGYPLCADLHDDQFLRQGARYEFLAQEAPSSVLQLRPESALYQALCSADGSGSCRFSSSVVLGTDLTCYQEECRTTHPRVIKVGEAFYEFVPPACVHFFFFEGRIATGSASRRFWQSRMICTNPETFVAGAYCCDGCSNIPPPQWLEHGNCQNLSDGWFTTSGCNIQGPGSWWDRNRWCEQRCDSLGLGYAGNCTKEYEEAHVCGYHQEYMSYEAATRRCAEEGLKICDRGTELTTCGLNDDDNARVWTPEACTTNVTVDEIGRVSSQRTDKMKMNRLRVQWTNGFPDVQNCPSDCTSLANSCECPIRVETRAVFNSLPTASELSALTVGALPPREACSHCGDVKAYTVDATFDEKTVFEYQGKYYRNIESLVYVAGKSFRNPPRFGLEEAVTERSARWEIESLLEHLVNHRNTPTFIGYRLIQRFVTSNPSPGYIFDVAEAFKTGTYQGHTFSGRRGDLAATIAAILLHPEALGAASRRGALREPLIKLVHFLRAMDFEDAAGREIMFLELQELIGQGPFGSPSVFNFYRADYQSNTMPADVVAPEAQIMDASNMVNFLNGMLSLIKNGGVTDCDRGFGLDTKTCDQKSFKHGLNITQSSATQVLDDLNLLLTGGRMTNATKDVARASLEGWGEEQKVKAAQEAVILAPEFHTIGSPLPEGPRSDQTQTNTEDVQPRSYKALINLYLNGGADTFNLLVPLDCTLHDEYMAVRGQAALLNSELLEIQTTGQACSKFGVHHKLPVIQQLYRDGKAAFVSNVGSLVQPLNRNEYDNGLKPVCAGLFSHSDQTEAAQTLKCQIRGSAPKGVGGRMADALSAGTQQFRTASYSLSGRQTWAQGVDINQISVARSGEVPTLQNYTGRRQLLEDLSNTSYGNVYCEEYARNLGKWVDSNQVLSEQLQTANLSSTWPEGNSIQDWSRRQTMLSFQTVAKLIASREARKVERDFFYVELRGFDTHNDVREVMEELFDNLNFALEYFVAELKAQGIFDATTLVTSSDFGRTLTSNGKGTDHGWAGNYVVLGGAVKGGQVYNRFPSSLIEGNNQDAGRGRMIPEYPWENVLMPIAEWMGVEGSHQRDVFPNIQNFNASHILATNVLFAA